MVYVYSHWPTDGKSDTLCGDKSIWDGLSCCCRHVLWDGDSKKCDCDDSKKCWSGDSMRKWDGGGGH